MRSEKVDTMNTQGAEPIEKGAKIRIRTVDPSTVSTELQLRLEEIRATVRRLEEAKTVSQETMQLEVSI
jgi:hypothetical protein